MIIGPVTLISSIPNRIVPFELVTSAAYRIRNGIEKTPCDVSLVRYELVLSNLILKISMAPISILQKSHMSRETGMDIYLKKDYMQYTGSFKERGAR